MGLLTRLQECSQVLSYENRKYKVGSLRPMPDSKLRDGSGDPSYKRNRKSLTAPATRDTVIDYRERFRPVHTWEVAMLRILGKRTQLCGCDVTFRRVAQHLWEDLYANGVSPHSPGLRSYPGNRKSQMQIERQRCSVLTMSKNSRNYNLNVILPHVVFAARVGATPSA